MLIKNANIRGRQGLCDIRIKDVVFAGIAPGLTPEPGEEVLDAAGAPGLTPYVDSHCHLDYGGTYGDPESNMSGTLFEGIRIWGERKKTITKEDAKSRARHVLQ